MRKHWLLTAMIVCLLAFVLPGTAAAAQEGTCGETLTWQLEEGTLTISGTGDMYDYAKTDEVPWHPWKNEIRTLVIGPQVTGIGVRAFCDCDALEFVEIPDNVLRVGQYALNSCDKLKQVVVGDGVTQLGKAAFGYSAALEEVTLGNGLTVLEENLFYNCTGLVKVTLGTGLRQFKDGAFFCCYNLKDVYISDLRGWCEMRTGNYTSTPMCYADNLYVNGQRLEGHLVIPEGTQAVAFYAFRYCTELTAVTIPDSVTKIGENAFPLTEQLKSLYISDLRGWCEIDFDNYSSNPMSSAKQMYLDGEPLSGVLTIPEGTTKIGNYAFLKCTALEQVILPDSVLSLGRGAFQGCTGITAFDFGGGVSIIEDQCFNGCSALKKVQLPDSVTFIGEQAFVGCAAMEELHLGSNVATIESWAFKGCKGLTQVQLPASVNQLGTWVFQECAGLTAIWTAAENSCYLSDAYGVLLDKEMTRLVQVPAALSGSYVLPDTVTQIPENAFAYCTALEDITLGSGVESIGFRSFYGCTQLRTVSLQEGLTSIDMYAFTQCSALEQLVLPESLTTIGMYAFNGCSALQQVQIPVGLTSVGESAFSACGSLTGIWVAQGHTVYASDSQGVLMNADMSQVIQAPGALAGSYRIADSVTEIKNSAFQGCDKLVSITMTPGVRNIGYYAFAQCTGLKHVLYTGTQKQWNTMQKKSGNECMVEADRHYTAVGDEVTCTGAIWHCTACEKVLTGSGWLLENGGWVLYDNGEKRCNAWVQDSMGWCYVDADGYCVTNCWKQDSIGWCYLNAEGRMAINAWILDSVGWCYVGADGYCVTNCWMQDSIGWCYLNAEGRMAINAWILDSVGWCYVDADGYCVTNSWKQDSIGWCYLNAEGRMATNAWVQDSVGWCYVGADGYMVTNTSVDGYWIGADGYWLG